MSLIFEWDKRKAESNRQKHGVSFEEAATAFGDTLSITIPDPAHSEGEIRFLLIGLTTSGRVVVVAHTERGDNICIINARPATRKEIRDYEQGAGQ
jgi:uncharacterized DUF497 family protein